MERVGENMGRKPTVVHHGGNLCADSIEIIPSGGMCLTMF